MGFGTTPEGSDSIPISCTHVPNTANLIATQGTLATTDGSSNTSALVEVAPLESATTTFVNIGASVTSVTLLALNTLRRGMEVFNDSSVTMYLKKGSGASSTSFSTKVPPQTLYEAPAIPRYTGIYTVVWDSATGTARGTELS
jgi:hypothetical protein